jgi:hypothetical protein
LWFFIYEEEAKARKAREEEAAALEFEKWKGDFSVDAEGTIESEVQDGNQDLLSNFVEYIKVIFSPVYNRLLRDLILYFIAQVLETFNLSFSSHLVI